MADEKQSDNTKQADEGKSGGGATMSYEDWIATQPDEVKSRIEGRTRGLESALDSERTQRKDIEKQLRETAKLLEKGSEARKAVEEQADRVKAAEVKAAFYDAAHAAGCVNLRLAHLAAQDAKLIRDDGSFDVAAMKEKFPQLFQAKPPAPKGHAGEGTKDTKPPGSMSISDAIRVAAGAKA